LRCTGQFTGVRRDDESSGLKALPQEFGEVAVLERKDRIEMATESWQPT
jgi:hypothetical protein